MSSGARTKRWKLHPAAPFQPKSSCRLASSRPRHAVHASLWAVNFVVKVATSPSTNSAVSMGDTLST